MFHLMWAGMFLKLENTSCFFLKLRIFHRVLHQSFGAAVIQGKEPSYNMPVNLVCMTTSE